MRARYVEGSAQVFNRAIAVRGSEQTRALDHLPVFADFGFGGSQTPPDFMAEVRILSVLPNPEGPDVGREQVTLGNGTAAAVDLMGWMLRDRAGNRFALIGVIPAGQQLTITMHTFSMPLNNAGDDVSCSIPRDSSALLSATPRYRRAPPILGGCFGRRRVRRSTSTSSCAALSARSSYC
jgi:hypothetical protein